MQKSDAYGPIMFELRGDGFLTVTIAEEIPEIEVTQEIAENIVDRSLRLLDGNSHPFLFLYRDLDIKIDAKVSRFIASHAALNKVKKAEAIVTSSLSNRLIVNWFARFFNPPSPVRVFKREEEARKWLSKFL